MPEEQDSMKGEGCAQRNWGRWRGRHRSYRTVGRERGKGTEMGRETKQRGHKL